MSAGRTLPLLISRSENGGGGCILRLSQLASPGLNFPATWYMSATMSEEQAGPDARFLILCAQPPALKTLCITATHSVPWLPPLLGPYHRLIALYVPCEAYLGLGLTAWYNQGDKTGCAVQYTNGGIDAIIEGKTFLNTAANVSFWLGGMCTLWHCWFYACHLSHASPSCCLAGEAFASQQACGQASYHLALPTILPH